MFRLYKDDIEKMQQMTVEGAWAYYEAKQTAYQESQRYNGWEGEEHNRISARFTWHFFLVMEPDDDDYVLDAVKELHNKDEVYEIADWLKKYYEDIVYTEGDGFDIRNERRIHPVALAAISDMMDWINWPTVAEHVIDAIEEEEDDAVGTELED